MRLADQGGIRDVIEGMRACTNGYYELEGVPSISSLLFVGIYSIWAGMYGTVRGPLVTYFDRCRSNRDEFARMPRSGSD